MKKICLVLLVALCFCAPVSGEAAVSELGDVCLSLNPDAGYEGMWATIQVGVLAYGPNHFVLNGIMTGALSADVSGPAHGTATLDGENIVISLTNTSIRDINLPNYEVYASELHIVLNGPDFSGRYILIGLHPYQPNGSGGKASLIPCK